MSNITLWGKFEGEEQGKSETTDEDAGKRWTEPPNMDEHMDEDEGEEGDEATITTEDTMKVVGYFTTVNDHKDYVNSSANNKRIDKFAWMIENLKLDLRNYNSMLELTRREMDDTIAKYKPCLGQNNWMMQRFLDTNLTARRQAMIERHSRMFATLEDAQANKLEFEPWWKDASVPDKYHGDTPQTARVSSETPHSHSRFLKERRAKSLPRGGPIDSVARMAMTGMRIDERQTRRGRSPSVARQTRGAAVQNVDDTTVYRELFTTDWTAMMEANFLDQRITRHGSNNRAHWDQLTNAMKKLGASHIPHCGDKPHHKRD